MKKLTIVFLLLVAFTVSIAQKAPKQDLTGIRDQILSGNAGSPQTPANQGSSTKTSQQQAKEILSNPLYRETLTEKSEKSWLDKAFERFGEWLSNLFPKPKANNGPAMPGLGGGALLIQFVIYILIAALIGFLIFMLAKIRFKNKKSIEGEDGLVAEEEIGRTADQWLVEADRLAAIGDFRSAIRCLYLACLTRLDENNILRFERHETNWEHLYRFRNIAKKPGRFDLQPLTAKFDQAWYGYVPQNHADLDWFKEEYKSLLQGIREAKP